MNVSLCIPVYRPGFFNRQCAALRSQRMPFRQVLFLDSSPGGFPGEVRDFGRILRIDRKTFDHGGTRRLGAELLAESEIIVFLTEDAVPAGPEAIARLVSCFADEKVGAAFGRQLPQPGASPIEEHARLFNYPAVSLVKTFSDIPKLGLKAAFISNSFAAYRRTALVAVGGFPEKNIVSEDTLVAARMLLAGWKVAYCSEARVYHSHGYSLWEEFQRYFDIGVFHAREPWIQKTFGGAEREGLRFLRSELEFLQQVQPALIPSALARLPVRYLGFRAGLGERFLPRIVKRRMSMQKNYWRKPVAFSPLRNRPEAVRLTLGK